MPERPDTPFDAAAADARLRASCPAFADLLSEQRFRTAIAPRLRAVQKRTDPFPFVFEDHFLPAEYYELLRAAWPPDAAFRWNKTRKKGDLVPREDGADEMTGRFTELPSSLRDVWRFFTTIVNRRVVGPWLAEVFRDEIDARVASLLPLYRDGRCGFTASGLERGGVYEANSGRLMMRGSGYRLEPHTDAAHFLVTALHYFADGASEEFGTTLFKAERNLPMAALIADGTTPYFHEHGIAVHAAARMPFTANAFLAFPNRLDAAHGVVAPAAGYRNVFQYHLSLKGDQEPL